MANEVLVKNGTTVTWRESGQGGTYTWTLASLATNTGRKGPKHDLGTTRAGRYRFRVKVDFASNPTAGAPVGVYLATSDDDSLYDGNLAAGDGAASDVDVLRQLLFVGNLPCDNVTTTQVAHFEIETGARYVFPVLFNAGGQAFSSTATELSLAITPIVTELQ